MKKVPLLIKEEKIKEKKLENNLPRIYKKNRILILILIFINSFLIIKTFNLDILFFDFYKEYLKDATVSFLEKAKKLTAWFLSIIATIVINTTYGVLGNFAYSLIQKKKEEQKEKKKN